MTGGTLSYVPARGGRPHLKSLLTKLDRVTPAGAWQPGRVIARGAELLKRRGVVLVVSDFYDAEEEIRRELRRVARRGHDAGMLQIVSPEETAFPYDGDLEFEDLESGERRLVDASAIGARYNATMRAFLARCQTEARRDGIDYVLVSTGDAPEHALRSFLLRRTAPV
jgi:hypothetical protein